MIQEAQNTNATSTPFDRFSLPDESGRFGPYGGSFVPETLSHPLRELNDAYRRGCDPMLSGSGLGNDALLAHSLGKQGLAEGIVDLVGSGMQQDT